MDAVLLAAIDKLDTQLAALVILACSLLCKNLTEEVTFIEGQSSKLVGQQCNLLLEDKESVCLLCNLTMIVVQILDSMRGSLGIHIILMNTCSQRTGAIDGSDSGNADNFIRLHPHTELLSAGFGELESTRPLAAMENLLVDLLIVEIDNIWMQVLIIEFFNICKGWIFDIIMPAKNVLNAALHHLQRCQPKKVIFNKSHRLKVANVLTF